VPKERSHFPGTVTTFEGFPFAIDTRGMSFAPYFQGLSKFLGRDNMPPPSLTMPCTDPVSATAPSLWRLWVLLRPRHPLRHPYQGTLGHTSSTEGAPSRRSRALRRYAVGRMRQDFVRRGAIGNTDTSLRNVSHIRLVLFLFWVVESSSFLCLCCQPCRGPKKHT
jgi:hypothetical protein